MSLKNWYYFIKFWGYLGKLCQREVEYIKLNSQPETIWGKVIFVSLFLLLWMEFDWEGFKGLFPLDNIRKYKTFFPRDNIRKLSNWT